MKKFFTTALSCLVLVCLLSLFPVTASAEPEGITLPEVHYPTMSYATFSQVGLPYDALLACFPEKVEVTYENGTLKIPHFGAEEAYFFNHLDYVDTNGTLTDGVWQFGVSAERYQAGGLFYFQNKERTWSVEYDKDGNRAILNFQVPDSDLPSSLQLYPEEGYGEQYVCVSYTLHSDLEIQDTYSAGVFYGQTVFGKHRKDRVVIDYDKNGTRTDVSVLLYETGNYVSYYKGIGWTSYGDPNTPIATPVGFEGLSYEELVAIAPTDIGCEHVWGAPGCDLPSICSLCRREKGSPTGHEWQKESTCSICATCGSKRYHAPEVTLPLFTKAPRPRLEQTGINPEFLTLEGLKNIETKYENGIFTIANIDGFTPSFVAENTAYRSWSDSDGTKIEIDEKLLGSLAIDFQQYTGDEESGILYSLYYDTTGKLTCASVHEQKENCSLVIRPEQGVAELTYYTTDEEDLISYTDTYHNGILSTRTIQNLKDGVSVYYNSDLEIEWVAVYQTRPPLYFIPDKGWSEDTSGSIPASAPEGFENKDAAYFAAEYPHGIDFCIHTYEAFLLGEKCSKCGDSVFDLPAVLLLVAAVIGVVAAVTGTLLWKKKQATAKAAQDHGENTPTSSK